MASGYRPPSREPQGRWARHIHAKRREWGWSQTRGFEAVREGLGLGPKSRAAYVPIDEGRRGPTPAEEAVLVNVYGLPPDEPELVETPPADMAALIAALADQTSAINLLVSKLDGLAATAIREGVAAALREVAGRQGGGGSQSALPPGQLG